MPLKTIDQIDDANKYKTEMIIDLKRVINTPQKFSFFVDFKGKSKSAKVVRSVLVLHPCDDKVVSQMKELSTESGKGTYTTNSDQKLVFEPDGKAKLIAKMLSAMGLKDKVQLAAGDSLDGDAPTATTAQPEAPQAPTASTANPAPVAPPKPTAPVPPPQSAKPTATAPNPVVPPKPTAPVPPPQSAKPTATAPSPVVPPKPTAPVPPPQSAKPTATAPNPVAPPKPTASVPPPQSAKPTPPAPPPQSAKPTGPAPTGWKPGVTPPQPGGTPPRPTTPAPVGGTTPPVKPVTPVTPPSGIEEEAKQRLAEVQKTVKDTVAMPEVPPAVRASLESRIKNIEILLKAKRWTDTMEGLDKIEADAQTAAFQYGSAPTDTAANAEAEMKKVMLALSKVLEKVTADELIPTATKNELAADYKKAVAQRDLKQFENALELMKKVRKDADFALASRTTPMTKKQADEMKKLSPKDQVHEQEVANTLIENQIQADILIEEAGVPELGEIMAEHRAYVPRELKAFRMPLRSLEDLGRIRNDKQRVERLNAMNEAFAAATDREKRFKAAMDKIKDKNSPAWTNAVALRASLTSHIPAGFAAERLTLGKRLETLVKSSDEKKAELTEMMKIKNPDPARKAEMDEETKDIMAAIEHGSLKSGNRTEFYFDAPVKAITREQGLKMQAAYDKVIARAYKIRDLGGSPADAEAALAHIPPDFWPPAFIENLQAWRKVERELSEERVGALFKKNPGFKLTKANVKEGLKMLSGALGGLEDITDNVSGLISNVSTAADAIGGATSTVATGAKTVSNMASGVDAVTDLVIDPLSQLIDNDEVADAVSGLLDVAGSIDPALKAKLEEGDYSGMTDKQLEQGKDWLDHMETAGKTVKSVVSQVANLQNAPGMEATSFALHVCPILSIVATGIDIGLAMKQLAREIQRRVQTTGLKNKAEVRYYSGEDWDGGSLVDAFKNEIKQRDRNVTQQTVDITGKGVAMSGDIVLVAASASPGGQGAGVALKVVGKGIQVGNKMVFTGIDWGIANQAKKLVAEARAGNPVARQQLFADSALYSKMYIAILAKEEHPLAVKFLTQRKYEEKDIMNEAISLKVIREALMGDAGQKDENEINDSLVGHFVDTYAGGAKKVVVGGAKAVASGTKAVAKKVGDKVKGRDTPYDDSWREDTPAFDQASWDKVKAGAVAAGLRDDPTGIGAALKKVEELKNKEAATQPPKKVDVTLELIAEYGKAAEVVGSTKPLINDESKAHAGMVTYLAVERSALLSEGNRLRKQLMNIGVINTKWKPVAGGGVTAATWGVNWASAVKETHMDADDAGVGKALKAFEDVYSKVGGEADKLKKRALQVQARDLIAPAAKAMSLCWVGASEFETVRNYIDQEQDELMKLSRELDSTTFNGKWEGPAAPTAPKLAKAEFDPIYDYAKKEGYVSVANKVSEKLDAVEKGAAALDKMPPSPAKRKARDDQKKLVAAAVKAIEELTDKTGETHATFKTYVRALRTAGHAAVAAMALDSQNEKFAVTKVSLDPADFESTFANAVLVGAIANETKPKKAFSEALKNLQAGIKKVDAGKTKKDKYKQFLEVAKLIEKVQDAHKKLHDIDGANNEVFSTYLDDVFKQGEGIASSNPTLKGFVDGSGVGDIKATTFVWKDADWQKMKKAAIEEGLYPDAKTMIGETLTASGKVYDAFDKAKGDPAKGRKPAEEALQPLKLALSMMTTQVDRAKQIKKAELTAYWTAGRDEAKKRVDAVEAWLKANPAPAKK